MIREGHISVCEESARGRRADKELAGVSKANKESVPGVAGVIMPGVKLLEIFPLVTHTHKHTHTVILALKNMITSLTVRFKMSRGIPPLQYE